MKKTLIFLMTFILTMMVPLSAFAASESYLWVVPASQKISSGYKTKSRPTHDAIDIVGGGDILATKSGKVVKVYTGCSNHNRKNGTCKSSKKCSPNCGYSNGSGSKNYCNFGFGNGIIIKHDDGSGYSMYAHLDKVTVKEKASVTQGAKIGTMGSSGNSSGVHLHFQLCKSVEVRGNYYAPQKVMNPSPDKINYIYPNGTSTNKTPDAKINLSVSGVTNVKKNSARVNAKCKYNGKRPDEVSVYVGTTKNNLKKYDSDVINHSKNPFNIWYDLKNLKPNQTYYYQFHVKVNGVDKAYGDVCSFKTLK